MIGLGVMLPTVGRFGERDIVIEMAQHAEALGFDTVWVTDHVALPFERRSPYPYPQGGVPEAIYSAGVSWLDPVATLGIVGGATQRIQLGTSVIVLPYRNPLVLANETASLDRLSGGRLILGVGAGWLREEFEAIGVRFSERAARTDESIRVLKHLWTVERANFQGRFWSFADVALACPPLQPAGPAILVGGNSRTALERAGSLGDGWHGMDVPVEELAEKLGIMRSAAEKAGRDPSAILPTVRRGIVPPFEVKTFAPDRRAMGPSTGDVAREMDAYWAAGVTHLGLDFTFPPDQIARVMEWVAKDVRPLLG